MKKYSTAIFILILGIGVLLRLLHLGAIPNSLNWDEVSWGYNAYSVLTTGKDEYGTTLPLSFQAFGDYKQPVYVYLTSLSIFLFGLNSFAVRFPSAILGILTIPFVWLLAYELFKSEKYRGYIALLAMFFFAISPWSIQFSRVAYEANAGIFFLISGAAIFLRALNTKNLALNFLAVPILAISCYTYHSQKIFTPLLFIALLLFSCFSYKLPKKVIVYLFVLFLICNLLWLVDPRTTSRGRSVTFYSNQTETLKPSTEKLIYDAENRDTLGTVLHNRRIVYLNKYLENYLLHFSPNYLFVSGDSARHHAYGMGILYLSSLPLILLGAVRLANKKYWLVFAWLLLAPIASSLAVDAPNASRSLVSLPIWHIFEAAGVISLIYISRKKIRLVLLALIGILMFANIFYYIHNYFAHTDPRYGIYWQEGYKEVSLAASSFNDKQVFLSPKYEQPYIFYLFYNKINPSDYQKSGGSERIMNSCYHINNVNFGNCTQNFNDGSILITGEKQNRVGAKLLREISRNGKVYGYIYEFR